MSVAPPLHEFRLLSENVQLNVVFEDLEQRAECDPNCVRHVVCSLYRSGGVRQNYGRRRRRYGRSGLNGRLSE